MSDLLRLNESHLVKGFAPKAQTYECEAPGDNAEGDGEGVAQQPCTNHPANGHAGDQPEKPNG
jgi:hypothetical protein